jgi:uncharacterized protein (TIGR02677 family)
LADYQLSIPRLDDVPLREDLIERFSLQWHNLNTWFVGSTHRPSDILELKRETHEAIRRITRFAQRLGERHHNHKSRRRDYLQLAQRFSQCIDIDEAHILSACVFGLSNTRHFYAPTKDTEDIYAEVWDRPPVELNQALRIRNYRPKTRPNAIIDRTEDKNAMLAQYLQEKEQEASILNSLISGDKIEIKKLGTIEPHVRRTLLVWISRALANEQRIVKTESGRRFKLLEYRTHIILRCTDGDLQMPDYILKVVD